MVKDNYNDETKQEEKYIKSTINNNNGKRKSSQSLITALLLFIALTVVIFIAIFLGFLNNNNSNQNEEEKVLQIIGSNAAVASDSSLCSQMGLDVIQKQKGNAIDAGIVTALCLGITRPFASGIGGGGFIYLFMNQTKKVDFIDARETAPLAARTNMYENNYEASVFGGKAIAVPGELKGLWKAHQLYGKLKWKELFTNVIELSRNGWKVEKLMAIRLKKFNFKRHSTLVRWFTKRNRSNSSTDADNVDNEIIPLEEGDWMKRPELANTLELIAEHGVDYFYKGELAKMIVEEIKEANGIITLEDLEKYEVLHSLEDNIISPEKYKLKFGDYTIFTSPPPSAGPVIKLILNILKHLPFNNKDNVGIEEEHSMKYHYMLEALKFGMAHRSALGDLRFLTRDNITNHIVNQLLSDEYAKNIAKHKVNPSKTFSWNHYYPKEGGFTKYEGKGTSHFSIVDTEGNTFAMTTTVNHDFGSKYAGQKTGIVYNNHMNDFTVSLDSTNDFGIQPSVANIILPGKRPQSSMSPTIILDKDMKVKYVIGASGGPTIIPSILQVFMRMEKFNIRPQQAVSLPRFHAMPGNELVRMEEGLSSEIIENLKKKGHQFTPVKILPDGATVGVCQLVQVEYSTWDKRKLSPATDPRKLGTAVAF
ncbi:hypothetical protein ABK040_013905 [Willaertia magna]